MDKKPTYWIELMVPQMRDGQLTQYQADDDFGRIYLGTNTMEQAYRELWAARYHLAHEIQRDFGKGCYLRINRAN